MINRQVRRQVRRSVDEVLQEIAAAVTIPSPFSIETLRAELASYRNRGIELVLLSSLDFDGLAGPLPFSGVWLAGESTDYVFYDDRLPTLARENVILHEFAHMLLEHHSSGEIEDVLLLLMQQMRPDLDAATIRSSVTSAQCRTRHLELDVPENELAAELLATGMWELWGDQGLGQPGGHLLPADSEVLLRFAAAMDFERAPDQGSGG